jgi:hypothetical protein
MDGSRQRVVRCLFPRQETIDDQVLLRKSDCRELVARTLDLTQCGRLSTGHEDQAGTRWIRQCVDSRLVLCLLLFQASQRSETRRVALAGVEEPAPIAGQLQQPDRVPGARGIEDDVIEAIGRN